MRSKFWLTAGLAAVLTVATVGFPRAAQEPVDTASVEKIKAIGLDPDSSKVMEIASYLTDVHGPRSDGLGEHQAGRRLVGRADEGVGPHRRRARAVARRPKRPERRIPVRLDERQVLSRGDAAAGVSDSRHTIRVEPGHERSRAR